MKRIRQISNRKKIPLYLLFACLTATFDRMQRKWLLDSIRLRFPEGEHVKLFYFDILGNLYQKTSLTYQEAQVTFLITSGVHQGDPESPCFFNLQVDFVMHVFMSNCMQDDAIRFFKHQFRINARSISREQRLRMHNENVQLWGSSTVLWCSYADNLTLFMLAIHSLQRATTIFDKLFTNYGRCIHVSKTQTMVLNYMLLEHEYHDTIISLRNVPLQNSTEFKYFTRETLKLITVSRWNT